MQLQHQSILPCTLELIPVGEDHKQTLQGNFDGFVVIYAEEVDVVADDVGGSVQCVNRFGVAGVGHVGEDVADLSLDIVTVHIEELQDTVDESSGADHGLDLRLAACGDVGQHPTCLTSDYFLMMIENLLEQAQDIMRKELIGVINATG